MDQQHDHEPTTDEIVRLTEDLLERSRRLLDDLDAKLEEGDRRSSGERGRRSA
jgi:hypothetical protein